ncbi:arsenate reductase ArsC [Halopseudomonas sp.]|uniref:arsenate reductase ArsC n=1 Tax=Halopseudomonas sp. TaxID=2901191 RepID=UPI00356A0E25
MLLNDDAPPMRLLVLCTGNSARSIIAEELFNRLLGVHIQAFSAGSNPTGRVNPLAMEQLSEWSGAEAPRSKSWDEFLTPDAVPLDIVLTVCGNAGQACPQFPGTPQRVHWGLPDPAAVQGSEALKRCAFDECHHSLRERINGLAEYLAPLQGERVESSTLAAQMRSFA